MAKWATITDDFPGSALSALWDGNFGTFSVSGNKARFDSSGYSGADSVQHDLSSSSVFIKVEALATGYAGVLLRENGSFLAELNYSGTGSGTLTGRYYGSNFGASDTSASTNLGAGARTIWYKFSHASTTLTIAYSTDGTSYTTLHTASVTAGNCDQVELYLDIGPDPGSSSGNQLFSSLNIAPSSPVALDGTSGGSSSTTADMLKGELRGSSGGSSATGSTENKAVGVATSGYMTYSNNPSTQADYTLTGWFKPASGGATKGAICVNPGAGGGSRTELFYIASGPRFSLSVNGAFTNATNVQAAGSWYHVALVVTGTTAVVYVNGALEITATVAAGNKLTAADNITFGARRFTAAVPSNFMDTDIDEGMLFTRALTLEEVQFLADATRHEAHYQPQALALVPYAWWRLSDTSGTTAVDSSGNARDGTYPATGVTYSKTGRIPFTSPPELLKGELSGSAGGTSTATGDLSVAMPLTGSSSGGSTADGTINVPVFLDGTSGGGSSATGDPTYLIGLDGSAAGAAGTTADLTAQFALVGTADGAGGTPAAQLDRQLVLTGSAGGVATTTATLLVEKLQMELETTASERYWEAQTAPPRMAAHKNARRSYEVAP